MEGTPRVCVVVDKHTGVLGPSETFLRAHVERLPTETVALIGNPVRRRRGIAGGRFLHRQSVVPRGFRWLLRQTRLDTLQAQDTRKLVRFLRREGVDLVLAEYGPTAVSVADACRRSGVPLVAHFHGWDAYALPRDPGIRESYERVFRDSARIVAVSRDMVEQLVDLGAPREKVFWNPCGAHVPRDREARPGESGPAFVAVGRLVPKKAPFITLLAFAGAARDLPDATLDMVGDGPLLEPCRQLVRGLRLEDRVTFHGATSHEDVYRILERARCFVQHSVTAPDGDSEGTPVAVLEAMGMGLPVVSTRHGGIVDVVDEGRTGSLVDEYDTEGMTRALQGYGEDPDLARRIGAAARESVLESWSMERSIERLWELLRSVPVPEA